MTENEQQILALLSLEPMIAQDTIAEKLGISRSAVAGHIINLTKKGFIEDKGYVITPEPCTVVVGGTNIDLSGRSLSALKMQDSNPGILTSGPGGVARNIAESLSRFSNQVQLISAIGDDLWGEQLLASCRQANICMKNCLIVPGQSSSTYLSIHSPDGKLQLALNDMGLLEALDATQLAQRAGLFQEATVIVVDANLSESALAYLFHSHADKPLFVDPVSSVKAGKLTAYLSHVHTLKASQAEAEMLAGCRIEHPEDLTEVTARLHGQGVKRLLITLGEQGAYASDEGAGTFIPATKAQVSNVTGAEDALMAGLVHGYLHQQTWEEAVEFALAAARNQRRFCWTECVK